MDHLPKIKTPAFKAPLVPLYNDKRLIYVRPFERFREREPDPTVRGQDWTFAYSNFVQEWLFFGLLQEMFAIFEIPFRRSDFQSQRANGRWFVSTEKLHEYVVALIVREHIRLQPAACEGVILMDYDEMWNEGNVEWLRGEREVRRIREWLSKAHDKLLSTRRIMEHEIDQTSLDPAVWDSVLLTAATLSHVTDLLYRWPIAVGHELYYRVDFRRFHIRSITDLRFNHLWCPNEARLIEELVEGRPQDMAFFSQLRFREVEVSHSLCTPEECVAHQITESYRTHHTSTECSCAMIEYMSDLDPFRSAESIACEDALDSNGNVTRDRWDWLYGGIQRKYYELTKHIPAVTFQGGELQHVSVPLTMTRNSMRPKMARGWNLVAISHVWSDGRGNPKANELPTCQLAFLQILVDSLFEENQRPVPFWIDTLMIPTNPRDSNGDQRLKKLDALKDMEWVYKRASKVLVLDSGLYSVNTTMMGPEEIGARIMCSTWSRRLWTLQEGCNKDSTFFQFEERSITWPDLHDLVLKKTSVSKWHDQHSKLLDIHPVRAWQKVPRSVVDRRETMKDEGPTTTRYYPLKRAKRVLDPKAFKVMNPVWRNIRAFLMDMSLTWSGSGLTGGALGRCIRAMYYRNCSKKADESLVLTSLLSAKPGSAAAISTTKEEDRLREVLSQLDIVPVELIFADSYRYEEPGCRWMPKSFLSVNAPRTRLPKHYEPIHHNKWNNNRGTRKEQLNGRRERDGLAIGLNGLEIQPLPCALSAPFRFEHQGTCYRVELRRPGSGESISNRETAEWVIIPENEFAAEPLQCRAILVKKLKALPRQKGAVTEFSALARLVKMTPEQWSTSSLSVVKVSLVQDDPHVVIQSIGYKATGSTYTIKYRDGLKWVVG